MRASVVVLTLVVAIALTACSPTTLDKSEMPRIMQLREDQLREQGRLSGIPEDTAIPELLRWITEVEYAPTMVSTA